MVDKIILLSFKRSALPRTIYRVVPRENLPAVLNISPTGPGIFSGQRQFPH
jgi:hypothetical protein